jgi:hypothetical protein
MRVKLRKRRARKLSSTSSFFWEASAAVDWIFLDLPPLKVSDERAYHAKAGGHGQVTDSVEEE